MAQDTPESAISPSIIENYFPFQSYSVLKNLTLRVFDFHLDYDIMVTKEIITVHKDFHKSFAQCFVSEVSLPFLSN